MDDYVTPAQYKIALVTGLGFALAVALPKNPFADIPQ